MPYVLLDNLDKHLEPWSRPKSSTGETKLKLEDITVVLKHKPFVLEVFRGSEVLVALNSRGLFQFEHLREKKACSTKEI